MFYDPFYVYADAASPLSASDEVGLSDIDRDDLWLLEDGHCFRNQVIHLCGRHTRRILPNVRFEAGSFETLRALIDEVGGFTLFPELTGLPTPPPGSKRRQSAHPRSPMSRSSLALFVSGLMLCASPAVAHADTWTDAFTRDGVASQRTANEKVIVLAAAGPTSTALSSATDALRAALGRVGGVTVKDLVNAGLDSADDPSVIALSHTLGSADAVFVLRVFDGTPATAVVSVFAQDGKLKRAFTASAGTPMGARTDKTGRGVNERQMKQIDEVAEDSTPPESLTDNERAYRREAIVVGTRVALLSGPDNQSTVVFGETGIYHHGQLIHSEPELYRALNRNDLAEAYESAESTRSAVKTGSIIVMGLGAVLMMVDLFSPSIDPETGEMDMTMLIAGAVTGGVGVIGYYASYAIDPSQASPSEMGKMISDHNEGLKQKYRLGEDTATVTNMRLRLAASSTGMGLQLRGEF